MRITAMESPFKSKIISEGSLHRKVFGTTIDLIDSDICIINFIIPFDHVKINKIDFHWFPEGCLCDLKIYDSPESILQISKGVPTEYLAPNKFLEQFGFDATICKDHHDEYSEYDADLLLGMKIEITIKNLNNSTKKVGCNIIYHEVKS